MTDSTSAAARRQQRIRTALDPNHGRKRIRTSYPTTCVDCGSHLPKGAHIWWAAGIKAGYCATCHQRP